MSVHAHKHTHTNYTMSYNEPEHSPAPPGLQEILRPSETPGRTALRWINLCLENIIIIIQVRFSFTSFEVKTSFWEHKVTVSNFFVIPA